MTATTPEQICADIAAHIHNEGYSTETEIRDAVVGRNTSISIILDALVEAGAVDKVPIRGGFEYGLVEGKQADMPLAETRKIVVAHIAEAASLLEELETLMS